jgi:D-alanyl-lipoteichoic acid acyltransferase DltB (MBOAT superfamily)
MIFSSDAFIFLFLPVWLLTFSVFSGFAREWINWLILGASLIFYACWDISFLPVLLGSVAVNFAVVVALKRERGASFILALGVVFNLALLGWYKYWCFFGASLGIVECDPSLASQDLPLAISFFTFQQIAYLVDIHRQQEAGKNIPKPVDYAAFVTFFPHLIAGPITRSNELLKPIEEKAYKITATTLEIGFAVFIIGFFKKVFLADPLAQIANPVFSAAESGTLDGLTAILGTLAFTLQIYFDFSGYSEMAVGLGLMVGIQLPWNFATPYASSSVTDFWRRWHITLSTILRDYLYIALGGNRRGEFRKHLNLMTTMVLGGLWHGANWTFVVWGALHGSYLTVAHLYKNSGAPRLPNWLATILTNAAVALAWIFFRAQTFDGAGNMLRSWFSPWNRQAAADMTAPFAEHILLPSNSPDIALAIAALLIVISYAIAMKVQTQVLMGRYQKLMSKNSKFRQVLALIAALTVSAGLLLQSGTPVEFIYFDF